MTTFDPARRGNQDGGNVTFGFPAETLSRANMLALPEQCWFDAVRQHAGTKTPSRHVLVQNV